MTEKEALKYLECIVGDGSMDFTVGPIWTEVLMTAIDALDNRVPNKPIMNIEEHEKYSIAWAKCKKCGSTLGGWVLGMPECNSTKYRVMSHHRCCPKCGQAIDWEDEE